MDNTTTIDLSLANIERAASIIDPVFRDTPQFIDEQLCAALGRRTIVKVETANPTRSFKGRGADFLIRGLDPSQKIVCASAGNFGQGMAYAGCTRGMAVAVFVLTDVKTGSGPSLHDRSMDDPAVAMVIERLPGALSPRPV